MPMTLGGYPLVVPTPEIVDWVDSWFPRDVLRTFVPPLWPPSWGLFRRVEERPRMPPPPIRFSEFHFPRWGLSRWGYGFFLIDAETAWKIRKDTGGNVEGSPNGRIRPVEFSFNPDLVAGGGSGEDGAGPPLNAGIFSLPVFAMPPVCLGRQDLFEIDRSGSGHRYSDGLYLQPIVDARYFLRDQAATGDDAEGADVANLFDEEGADNSVCDGDISDQVESLTNLVSVPNFETAIDADNVFVSGGDSDFSANFANGCYVLYRHPSLPVLLDALAASVGARWVMQVRDGFPGEPGSITAAMVPLWKIWDSQLRSIRRYHRLQTGRKPVRIAGEYGFLEDL